MDSEDKKIQVDTMRKIQRKPPVTDRRNHSLKRSFFRLGAATVLATGIFGAAPKEAHAEPYAPNTCIPEKQVSGMNREEAIRECRKEMLGQVIAIAVVMSPFVLAGIVYGISRISRGSRDRKGEHSN